jgi:hypothetical protein
VHLIALLAAGDKLFEKDVFDVSGKQQQTTS